MRCGVVAAMCAAFLIFRLPDVYIMKSDCSVEVGVHMFYSLVYGQFCRNIYRYKAGTQTYHVCTT